MILRRMLSKHIFMRHPNSLKGKAVRGYASVKRLRTFLALIRVRHTGQVVGIVSVLSIKSYGLSLQSLLAIASYLLLSIALFAFDDAHDYVSDSIAHPERPIPRGIFTPKQVYLIGTTFLILGIMFATNLMFYQFILFLTIAVLGLVVIFIKLKSVSRAVLTASIIFILFPASTYMGLKSVLFGLIVALPHIAGSIAKDFIHLKGDEKIGLESPPKWAQHLSSLIFFVSGGIVLLPVVLGLVTWLYIPLILPTFASCLILGSKVLSREYKKVYIYGGIGMISALVAFATNI